MEQRIVELLCALESAKRKIEHTKCYVSSYYLSDEEAEAIGKALDQVLDVAEATDDALFASQDSTEA